MMFIHKEAILTLHDSIIAWFLGFEKLQTNFLIAGFVLGFLLALFSISPSPFLATSK